MQEFLASPVCDFIWKVICVIIAVSLMLRILNSAKESLKRPGNKLLNILDEIIVGIIVFAVTAAILMQPLPTIFDFIIRIVIWFYDTFIVPLFSLFGVDVSL